MAGVRFAELPARPTAFLDLTSLILDEFRPLIPPFKAVFQAPMVPWRLDGNPTARRFAVYMNCPFPTSEDRLFFLRTPLMTYSLQVVPGRLSGMGQGKANRRLHVLFPALQTALRTLGEAPTRSRAALAQRRGVAEADAASIVAPQAEESAPVVSAQPLGRLPPLCPCRDGTAHRPPPRPC